jgi:glycosyl transferase, family 25
MSSLYNTDLVFVAHVKSGYESRRKSIDRQFSRLRIDFEYLLDGDIADITGEIKNRWFCPSLIASPKAMSCTCKHLMIYEKMVACGTQGALIFEDDIFLVDDFVAQYNLATRELFEREDIDSDRAWISYENSTLRYPPKSTLRPSQRLYRAREPRCTGAYYIGAGAAKGILRIADTERADRPIDCFVEVIANRKDSPVDLYWCHPTIAEQGSMSGVFQSMDPKRTATLWRKMKWNLDKYYKSLRHRAA